MVTTEEIKNSALNVKMPWNLWSFKNAVAQPC